MKRISLSMLQRKFWLLLHANQLKGNIEDCSLSRYNFKLKPSGSALLQSFRMEEMPRTVAGHAS